MVNRYNTRIQITLNKNLLAWIDLARGNTSRTKFIEDAITAKIINEQKGGSLNEKKKSG